MYTRRVLYAMDVASKMQSWRFGYSYRNTIVAAKVTCLKTKAS